MRNDEIVLCKDGSLLVCFEVIGLDADGIDMEAAGLAASKISVCAAGRHEYRRRHGDADAILLFVADLADAPASIDLPVLHADRRQVVVWRGGVRNRGISRGADGGCGSVI